MQFVDIEKKDGGAFLHRYDLHYIDRTGCPRTYEMVSRDRNIDSLEHLQHHRELREETGLRLTAITHVLPPAACTVGIGDERTVCVFGTAEGTFRPSADPMEEIESAWYTRAQVRALHETDLFGSWALAYSWMFANGCLPGV